MCLGDVDIGGINKNVDVCDWALRDIMKISLATGVIASFTVKLPRCLHGLLFAVSCFMSCSEWNHISQRGGYLPRQCYSRWDPTREAMCEDHRLDFFFVKVLHLHSN